MTQRELRLHLSAGEPLTISLSWIVEDGFLWLSAWNEEDSTTTLGIWGPGDLVIPSIFSDRHIQLCSLSAVQVEERAVSVEEHQAFVNDQTLQLASLLQISRIKQAEERLFRYLIWLGQRFGRVNSQGVGLSFMDMNLTHRNLAAMTGMSRVTVTKALIRFRQEERLCKQGNDELLRLNSLK